MVRSKKLSDADMKTLNNPNSILFYEVMYTCGDPFSTNDVIDNSWNAGVRKDLQGPVQDTIRILNLNGMTYIKAKTGTMYQFWLFDTGAYDLLVNSDMETQLKSENILTQENYHGVGEYEMANGMIDTCRKYTINHFQIGKFTVDNVNIAVTDKGKKIIIGKSLLNKFSSWVIDNKENILVLSK